MVWDDTCLQSLQILAALRHPLPTLKNVDFGGLAYIYIRYTDVQRKCPAITLNDVDMKIFVMYIYSSLRDIIQKFKTLRTFVTLRLFKSTLW